jgi:NAD(P)-dependent dehydrogenase (short-subunit alcohol dehydrogenase family)
LEAKLAALWTGLGRVLRMSSFAAQAHTFDADDWQLLNSTMPYEASKLQMDLSRAELSRHTGPSAQVRHFAVHPSVVDSSISVALDSGPKAARSFDLCQDFHVLSHAFQYQMCVCLGFN